MKSGITLVTLPTLSTGSSLSLRSSPPPPSTCSAQKHSSILMNDNDPCPQCSGSGYLSAESPCLTCPGPQLARYPTTYDGMGSKGCSSLVSQSSSSQRRTASLPITHPVRPETRVWIDGALIPTTASAVTESTLLKGPAPKPRWSLRMDWLKRREVLDHDADVECNVSPVCANNNSTSYTTTIKQIAKKLPGPRRSKRWNARAEVVMAESTLRELLAKTAAARSR
ncbi:hypothetical protein DFJ77DRAFT_252906 [Powellomyces hirtus]|nr:hypothetical protein DFJ77DRAFT_252906 [Powellomyces hirtus]